MILMKIFMNFYESREKVREEDVDVWGGRSSKYVYVTEYICLSSIYSYFLLCYLIWTASCNVGGVEK
jgi:hypothetical protein